MLWRTWADKHVVRAPFRIPGLKKSPVIVLIHEVLPIKGDGHIAAKVRLSKVPGAGLLVEVAGGLIIWRGLIPQRPALLAGAVMLRMVWGFPSVSVQLHTGMPIR